MDITQKNVWVKGLLVDCPYGLERADCILKDLRKESMNSRLIKTNLMSEEELDYIILHHKQCLQERETVQINP